MPECSSGHPRKPIDSCVAFTTTLAYACKQHAAIAVLKRRYPVLVGAEPDHVCEAGVGTQPLFDSIGIPAFINLTLEKLIAAFSHIEEQSDSRGRPPGLPCSRRHTGQPGLQLDRDQHLWHGILPLPSQRRTIHNYSRRQGSWTPKTMAPWLREKQSSSRACPCSAARLAMSAPLEDPQVDTTDVYPSAKKHLEASPGRASSGGGQKPRR